jgi:hypothetical protein
MEWDKKAIYYGDKATLRIKTFELSDESPTCKLQLWEKDYTSEDDFILEEDIIIDKDEVETVIEFKFGLKKFKLTEKNNELIIFAKLKNDKGRYLICNNSEIRIGVGFIYE